jgi:hypothetical protein
MPRETLTLTLTRPITNATRKEFLKTTTDDNDDNTSPQRKAKQSGAASRQHLFSSLTLDRAVLVLSCIEDGKATTTPQTRTRNATHPRKRKHSKRRGQWGEMIHGRSQIDECDVDDAFLHLSQKKLSKTKKMTTLSALTTTIEESDIESSCDGCGNTIEDHITTSAVESFTSKDDDDNNFSINKI